MSYMWCSVYVYLVLCVRIFGALCTYIWCYVYVYLVLCVRIFGALCTYIWCSVYVYLKSCSTGAGGVSWEDADTAGGEEPVQDALPERAGKGCFLARNPQPEGRCKATWKREFKLPWREAGPPNHHDDKVDSDQKVVNKDLSLSPSKVVNLPIESGPIFPAKWST